MKAVWGLDYDYRTDKSKRCPVCPECEEAVWKIKGVYRCLCCNSVVELEQDMKEWFAKREKK